VYSVRTDDEISVNSSAVLESESGGFDVDVDYSTGDVELGGFSWELWRGCCELELVVEVDSMG
jgi:hypothetical protein